MSIENRPYIGTWSLSGKQVVRHTPDCLVYINGDTTIPGCSTCGKRIDIQRFITSISVDPTVEPGSTASVTMQIPRSSEHALFRDGQFVLKPGLEINIYMRGYFAVQGVTSEIQPEETGGIDTRNAVVHPYYHVFHGVVTEASHEYSGGEHTASLQCADMLHFWGYQRMSTSGSVFGARPSNSGIKFTLVGHNFTGMTPYSIVYTLFRDVMGAAGGVEFALGSKTNASANSTVFQESLWSMALLYWENRFSSHFNNLRMYGVDGTLYNAFEQAFAGRLSTKETEALAKTFADPNLASREKEPMQNLVSAARSVGYGLASTYAGAQSEKDAQEGGLGINISQMQGFVTDISNWGNVNLFESQYETKLDILNTVREVTGFEFYQDVDGDFVFKPPFYNLDTSPSRVYRIRDIDIINISFSEKEPNATAVKATGSFFKNVKGTGLEGEWGTRSEYIDYRLVAQFGWRQETFETSYITNPRAMFFACVNRMDLYNVEMHSAQVTIPLRPELRPGYPVYLEPFDCYYYLRGFSHSFQFGGQCTTSLTLVGRRAKFYAPGKRPEDGSAATVDNIKLNDPWLPQLPIESNPEDVGLDLPRLQGFPNCVLAIDTELLNPNFFAAGILLDDLRTESGVKALIRQAKEYGVLELANTNTQGDAKSNWETGPYALRVSNDEVLTIQSPQALLEQVQGVRQARDRFLSASLKGGDQQKLQTAVEQAEAEAGQIQKVIDAVQAARASGIPERSTTANYLDLLGDLKATFAPGASTPGYYRYYSSSHPDPEMQGMRDLDINEVTDRGSSTSGGLIYLESPDFVLGFQKGDRRNTLQNIEVTAGIPLMRPNTGKERAKAVPTPTHQIATLSFVQHNLTKRVTIPRRTALSTPSFLLGVLESAIKTSFQRPLESLPPGLTVRAYFEDVADEVANLIRETTQSPDLPFLSFEDITQQVLGKSGQPIDPDGDLRQFKDPIKGSLRMARHYAQYLSKVFGDILILFYQQAEDLVGPPGQPDAVSLEDNQQTYRQILDAYATFVQEVSRGEVDPGLDDESEVTITIPEPKNTPFYTAVFPVSDHAGYEVIGSYAYGRGLTVDVGGTFQQLQDSDRFAHVSVDAADAFVAALRKTGSPAKAIGLIASDSPEEAAELAAAAGIQVDLDETGTLQGSLDPSQFENAFSNFVKNSKDSVEKVAPINVAYGLADIASVIDDGDICECKGAEADMVLQAFSGSYVALGVSEGSDGVTSWVRDQTALRQVPWQTSQNAMRGQILDLNNRDLARSFTDAVTGFTSGTRLGLAQEAEAARSPGNLDPANEED